MSYTLVPTELIVDGAITSAKLDTNIAISGTLGVTGEVTLATHLIMGDNDKIKIGTGGDLEIYHDGSNSYISNSTGNIYLGDTNGAVHIQAKLNEESIVASADGAVTLYHDNSAKLATASGGVTVTGTLTATSITSGNIAITTTGSSQISLLDSDNGFAASTINVENGGRDLKLTTPQDTIFVQGSTESMRILDGGNVGIGTSSPTVPLTVNNSTDHSDIAIFHAGGGTPNRGLKISTFSNTNSNAGVELDAQHSTGAFKFSTGGTERMRIDTSGKVGIGVSPANKLEIQHGTIGTGNGSNNTLALRYNSTTLYGQHYMDANGLYHIRADAQGVSGGNLILGGDASVQIWTGSTPEDRVVVDSSGAVGIGVVPQTNRFAGHNVLQIGARGTLLANDTGSSTGQTAFLDNLFYNSAGSFRVRDGSNATAGVAMQFVEGNTIFSNSAATTGDPTVIERMRINSSGDMLVGTTNGNTVGTVNKHLVVGSTTNNDEVAVTLNVMEGTNNRRAKFFLDDNDGVFGLDSTAGTGVPDFVVRRAGTEKMRIDNEVQFFKSNGSVATAGVFIQSSGRYLGTTNSNVEPMILNRQDNDGGLIEFRQANSNEGTISVSGSTVSYNGFSGTHETSGISTDTEIGTVCSTIDELDTYTSGTKEGQTRADHAKIKVSDTVGDTRVYGVLSKFNNNNKPIVASVGIGSVKVTGTCSGGDLLESNGDGTAKVQSDDIVRSKTIGKVAIGNSDTGVKLVSCVLYCG